MSRRDIRPSLLPRSIAALGIALVLLLDVLAAWPEGHAWLHGATPAGIGPDGHTHGPAQANDGDDCAVANFASGHVGCELDLVLVSFPAPPLRGCLGQHGGLPRVGNRSHLAARSRATHTRGRKRATWLADEVRRLSWQNIQSQPPDVVCYAGFGILVALLRPNRPISPAGILRDAGVSSVRSRQGRPRRSLPRQR